MANETTLTPSETAQLRKVLRESEASGMSKKSLPDIMKEVDATLYRNEEIKRL